MEKKEIPTADEWEMIFMLLQQAKKETGALKPKAEKLLKKAESQLKPKTWRDLK